MLHIPRWAALNPFRKHQSAHPWHPVAKRLLLIRGLRSIGQGAMVVDLTLYLKDLQWSGVAIGGTTAAAGLFGAALVLLVGVLSDKWGRKPFLLIFEGLTLAAAVAACLTTSAGVLIAAIVIAGFGRGQSGAAGPFAPAEQAWLARHVEPARRGTVFSANNAAGFFGMALGALTAGLPTLMHAPNPLATYRPVFLLVAVASVLCLLLLSSMDEQRAIASGEIVRRGGNDDAHHDADTRPVVQDDSTIRARENIAMLKFALVNTLNGLAVGLTGPMMAYWFSIRYGASAAAIGITLSVGFLMTGLMSIFSGYLAQRIGMVKSVTWMRVVGSAMMLVMPWLPTFAAASAVYVVRGAINRGTQGNRSALSASLTRDARRGLATSINALSMRLPASIGPAVTGYLFDVGQLSLPLVLTALLQLANAAVYQWVFGRYDVSTANASEEA